MNANQKALKKTYQQAQRPIGIWQIRNLVNDKVLIGAAMNLPGIINRQKFQLQMGNHPNKALQADWNELGSERFAFEILDEITPNNELGYDYRSELRCLEDLWLENLAPFGEQGYNEPRKSKEERLQIIMMSRRKQQPDCA
jgi:hypothetical protein